MRGENIFTAHKAWWSNATSSFVGTLLGIIVTFGTTSYLNQREKEETMRKTILLTINSVNNYVKTMEDEVAQMQVYDTIFRAVLKYHPDELHKVSKDTISLFFSSLSDFRINGDATSTENIFSHNMDIWKSMDDITAFGMIEECFTCKKMLKNLYQETENMRRQLFLDFCSAQDFNNYKTAEAAIRAFFKYKPEAFYLLIEYNAKSKMMEYSLKTYKKLCKKAKILLNVTDEELKALEDPLNMGTFKESYHEEF